jgi:hypothetical protein
MNFLELTAVHELDPLAKLPLCKPIFDIATVLEVPPYKFLLFEEP